MESKGQANGQANGQEAAAAGAGGANPQSSLFKRRPRLMQLVLLIMTLALGLVAAEAALRIAWHNPKDERPVGENFGLYVRRPPPNFSAASDLTGLFEGAGKVMYRTDENGAVVGPHHPGLPLVHFYGGSTTENGVVSEGQRWVDLLPGIDARNFGYAHNNMVNNYANFKYNLEHLPKPSEAFFMEAANDLVFSAMTPDELNKKPSKLPSSFRIYVYDFARILIDQLKVKSGPLRDYWRNDPYLKAQSQLAWLSQAEADTYLKTVLTPSLKQREDVIRAICALGRQHNVKITFLTQPDSYSPNFHPYEGVDMRTYPRLNGKMFTLEQSALLVKLTNDSTAAVAEAEGANVIDVAAAFKAQVPGPLFYDSFHYTELGTRFFASTVQAARAGGAEGGKGER